MKLQKMQGLTVHGISVRTNNQTESGPDGKIPLLWQRYMAAHPQPAAEIYAVYADYASDVNGDYTLTVGSLQDLNAETVTAVAAGDYLAFEVHGSMPEAIIRGWQTVWAYFSEPGAPQRAYRTDLEIYHGPASATILIGIVPPAP